MKIQFMSDLHNEFDVYTPRKVDADVVVLAGDIDVGERAIRWAQESFLDQQVIYVLGNHEYYHGHYPGTLNKAKYAARGSRVYVLDNERVTLHGVHFLGCTLWTDFKLFGNPTQAMEKVGVCMNDFRLIRFADVRRRFLPEDSLQLHRASIHWLRHEFKQCRGESMVVVTHHSPAFASIPERYQQDIVSSAFASDLETLVIKSGARLWIHGHTHHAVDYQIGDTRVVSNPRGYPYENLAFNPSWVIDVSTASSPA